MTDKEWDRHLLDFHDRMRQVGEAKGREYARSADRLANFKRLAEEHSVNPETVAHILLTKHLDSISYFVASLERLGTLQAANATVSELIMGRFVDAANYLVLLAALLVERGEREQAVGVES